MGTRKKTKQSVVAPGGVSRRHRRSNSPSSSSSSFPACSAGTASSETTRGFLLLERRRPSRNRRFYKEVLGNFLCVCACIFSSKKELKNTSKRTQQTLIQHALYQTKARWCMLQTSRSKTRPLSLANIHPSIGRRILRLPDRNADHHRRCNKTLERERERQSFNCTGGGGKEKKF